MAWSHRTVVGPTNIPDICPQNQSKRTFRLSFCSSYLERIKTARTECQGTLSTRPALRTATRPIQSWKMGSGERRQAGNQRWKLLVATGIRIPRHWDPWHLKADTADTQSQPSCLSGSLVSKPWPESSWKITRQVGDKLARAEMSVACGNWVTATWGCCAESLIVLRCQKHLGNWFLPSTPEKSN